MMNSPAHPFDFPRTIRVCGADGTVHSIELTASHGASMTVDEMNAKGVPWIYDPVIDAPRPPEAVDVALLRKVSQELGLTREILRKLSQPRLIDKRIELLVSINRLIDAETRSEK